MPAAERRLLLNRGNVGTSETGTSQGSTGDGDGDDNGDGDGDGSEGGDTPGLVAATGQKESFDVAGNTIDCVGTGQDGDIQAGVPHPSPRLTDLGDGTVRDNFTGLIWLRQADCLGQVGWSEALARSNALAEGECELSDGSAPGDWRLPNIRELMSLISVSVAHSALPEGHPFEGV